MPRVVRSAVEDTTVPGLARRRVWTAPAVRSHPVIVLTLAKLYLAPRGTPYDPPALEAIQGGADLDAKLGSNATVILLPTIKRVTLDLPTNTLVIEHAERTEVAFANYETADAVFTKVWRRLGEAFALVPHRRDPWETARFPVAMMAGVLLATITLSLVLNATADAGAASGLPAAVRWADWRWVGGFGGAVLAGIQVWLYRRLTLPASRLELAPKTDAPAERAPRDPR